jgi:hypothetical protein
MGWMIEGSNPRQGLGIFLFTTVSRPSMEPTQPPIRWVPGVLSLGGKRPEREADHSPPSSTEVKNLWSYTFTLQYTFMVWFSVKAQDNFTFTFRKNHRLSNYNPMYLNLS